MCRGQYIMYTCCTSGIDADSWCVAQVGLLGVSGIYAYFPAPTMLGVGLSHRVRAAQFAPYRLYVVSNTTLHVVTRHCVHVLLLLAVTPCVAGFERGRRLQLVKECKKKGIPAPAYAERTAELFAKANHGECWAKQMQQFRLEGSVRNTYTNAIASEEPGGVTSSGAAF